jgi:cellulose synthase/poly-beta-1,6-N-acetylglucosamine synthase-like glycosyltransferase
LPQVVPVSLWDCGSIRLQSKWLKKSGNGLLVIVLLALLLAPLILLTSCFAIELFTGLRRLRPIMLAAETKVTAMIVVPAHDEQAIIEESLRLLRERCGGAAILVVADNCTDSTADIARGSGVDVIERADPQHRGKGFALDFARLKLRSDPPDVVIVMDADCIPEPDAIERLIAACAATKRPCQGTYLQKPAEPRSPRLQLSTFAFFIKNVIRQRALLRLTGRIHLLGTGMALPWAAFDGSNLATGNIVEDLDLGLELADAGYPALLIEDAVVWSNPAAEESTLDQRRRWEGGYLQSAKKRGPALIIRSLGRADPRSLWAAISLFIPPVAMLVTLDLVALAIGSLVVSLTAAAASPVLALAAALSIAALAILFAWLGGGSRFITFGGLARVPVYLIWKIPMYLGFVRRGAPKDWVRTSRDEV